MTPTTARSETISIMVKAMHDYIEKMGKIAPYATSSGLIEKISRAEKALRNLKSVTDDICGAGLTPTLKKAA